MSNRRQFLQSLGALSAGVMLAPSTSLFAAQVQKVGLQLYSVKEDMEKDAQGTLKKLASFGYKELESYPSSKGIFFGMKPAEFKKFIGDLGMKVVSSHVDISKNFQKTVDEAASIEMKYLFCPYSKKGSIAEYQKTAAQFNKLGEISKKSGLLFGYHNHDYAFQTMEGQLPYDLLLKETDPKLVVMELDLYWVVKAGADPIAYFEKHPGRFHAVHVKDMAKDGDKQTIEIGKGSIDFASIFKKAKVGGVKHFFVEQEEFVGSTPLDSAKLNAASLAKLTY
jgi:sugar phosphate isomerase/epimerase